jgi:hypothetical protein
VISPNDNQPLQRRRPRFALGQTCATPGALEALEQAGQTASEFFHVVGDWGDVCAEDAQANEQAVDEGGRIMSVYRLRTGVTVWLISETDRSVSTILLPDEY